MNDFKNREILLVQENCAKIVLFSRISTKFSFSINEIMHLETGLFILKIEADSRHFVF